MKTKRFIFLLISTLSSILVFNTQAAVEVGKPAPEFSIIDTQGKTHTLKTYKGSNVVLEWTNRGCPFVRKHYDSQNMQKLQKDATDQGTTWLTVLSSAPGKQGNFTPEAANLYYFNKEKAHSSALLLDPSGTLGRLYGAKTTPHMYVINSKGILVYMGAIDDTPSTDIEDIKKSKNYVRLALDALKAGKSIGISSTDAYGCSVKYE